MADKDALSQVVSSFDTSAVTYSTNGWDEDVQSDFHNSTSSSEAATSIVTLTFRGTRAGAFGTMSSHGTEPLNGTIISLSTSKATPLPQSQPSDDNKTQAYYFADTQSLTCDTYNLTLSVDNRHQKMMLHQFAFAPCLVETYAPTSASSTPTPGIAATAAHSPSRIGLIVGCTLGGLLVVCALVAALCVFLCRRRAGRWLRLRGTQKQSPSAQYLASVEAGAAPGPPAMSGITNIGEKPPLVPGPGPPVRRSSEKKPLSPVPEADGPIVHAYLSDSKEWEACMVQSAPRSSVPFLPRYESRASTSSAQPPS